MQNQKSIEIKVFFFKERHLFHCLDNLMKWCEFLIVSQVSLWKEAASWKSVYNEKNLNVC